MKKLVGLLRGSIFFTFATFVEALAPFLLAPFLTRYISVYDYGIWAIFQSSMAFLRPMMGLALDDYIRIHYHHTDRLFITQYIIAILCLSTLILLVAEIAILFFGNDISALLLFPESGLWAIAICAWLYALFYIALTYHQFSGNYGYYSIIQFTQAAVTILLTISFTLPGTGWMGVIAGKMTGLCMGCIIGFILLFRQIRPFTFQFHFIHYGKLLSFGLRYLPGSLLITIIMLIDRLMLSHILGVEAASLYSVASLFPAILMIVIMGFMFGWQPWCFSRLKEKPSGYLQEIAMGALLYCVALPVGGVVLFYICRLIGPFFIGASFLQAFDYIFILIMAMVAQGLFMFSQSILQYYKKINMISVIAVMMIIVKVVLNYSMIEYYGINGAGMALIIVYGIVFIVITGISIRLLLKQAVV